MTKTVYDPEILKALKKVCKEKKLKHLEEQISSLLERKITGQLSQDQLKTNLKLMFQALKEK